MFWKKWVFTGDAQTWAVGVRAPAARRSRPSPAREWESQCNSRQQSAPISSHIQSLQPWFGILVNFSLLEGRILPRRAGSIPLHREHGRVSVAACLKTSREGSGEGGILLHGRRWRCGSLYGVGAGLRRCPVGRPLEREACWGEPPCGAPARIFPPAPPLSKLGLEESRQN